VKASILSAMFVNEIVNEDVDESAMSIAGGVWSTNHSSPNSLAISSFSAEVTMLPP
jgi:hypothetical protein